MSQDAINISLIHPFRRFTPGSCSWPHTSPTLLITSSPIPSANGRFLRNGTEWEEVM